MNGTTTTTNVELTNLLRYVAGTIMLSVAFFGLVVNIYVFFSLFKLITQNYGFYKICAAKTVSNSVTCLAFALWSAPCTFLDGYYLPYFGNMIWGQIAGWGAYIAGMLLQLCISLNRFSVSYFPLETSRSHLLFNIRNGLIIVIFISIGYTLVGLRPGCSYIYDVSLISWNPENSPCALRLADFMFYSILTLSCISNSCNFATFIKLVNTFSSSAGNGLISSQKKSKTRKSRIMLAQSVTQDCLHLTDMFSCQILYKFYDPLWFQFICMSVVWLSIHVLDGVVMLLYNKEIQPTIIRRLFSSPSELNRQETNKSVFSIRGSKGTLIKN